jgi:hypothetical protein
MVTGAPYFDIEVLMNLAALRSSTCSARIFFSAYDTLYCCRMTGAGFVAGIINCSSLIVVISAMFHAKTSRHSPRMSVYSTTSSDVLSFPDISHLFLSLLGLSLPPGQLQSPFFAQNSKLPFTRLGHSVKFPHYTYPPRIRCVVKLWQL